MDHGGNREIHTEAVVISIERDWSTDSLMKVMEARMKSRPVLLNPDSVSVAEGGLVYSGRKIEPELVIVRRLKPSHLQSGLTSSVLRGLEEGCKVINRFQAIATAANKGESSVILAKRGIPVPRFLVTRDFEEAWRFVREEGKVVQKPLYGFQGVGLRIITSEDKDKLIDQIGSSDPIYLQSYIEKSGWDGRILVAGKKPVAAMKRITGNDWRTNLARGGRAKPWKPSQKTINIAVQAVDALGLDYGAVDLVGDLKLVMEINGTPGWRGLQSVAEVNVAERLTEIFLGEG
ncbi:hypothetical protein AKJ43_02410 [candidate division MSBL1 archaeon SCGC-AAA261D19]|uniref:ATP-grasp domain-containing protein n=1 Tax=candidate division MSBL1 archaeon SCGC-AAA261D19 TaxID=1698273 RepID=A0A133V6S7_9EURY|nr:hypothetical protein AKJ43_02410 [candidate division MSBL1 archaeon SCGC-AAA261D19]